MEREDMKVSWKTDILKILLVKIRIMHNNISLYVVCMYHSPLLFVLFPQFSNTLLDHYSLKIKTVVHLPVVVQLPVEIGLRWLFPLDVKFPYCNIFYWVWITHTLWQLYVVLLIPVLVSVTREVPCHQCVCRHIRCLLSSATISHSG